MRPSRLPGGGADAWPTGAAYAVALALSGTTGRLCWQALDRPGSGRSPVITWLPAAGALLCPAGAAHQLRRA
ncbi:hypothetical protein [Streptomyces sp. DG1A-41]|uniref:hypothetical protein n=1 Tax=Streptomyces sp. DG1A-41 TaxID=3125779 RepID=UPI0030D563FB